VYKIYNRNISCAQLRWTIRNLGHRLCFGIPLNTTVYNHKYFCTSNTLLCKRECIYRCSFYLSFAIQFPGYFLGECSPVALLSYPAVPSPTWFHLIYLQVRLRYRTSPMNFYILAECHRSNSCDFQSSCCFLSNWTSTVARKYYLKSMVSFLDCSTSPNSVAKSPIHIINIQFLVINRLHAYCFSFKIELTGLFPKR
jgi:hypothetical protein